MSRKSNSSDLLLRLRSNTDSDGPAQAADNLPLYGVCCYMEEMVHRPPAILSDLWPQCSTPLSRYLVAAPRCYCFLTHFPFFTLHMKVRTMRAIHCSRHAAILTIDAFLTLNCNSSMIHALYRRLMQPILVRLDLLQCDGSAYPSTFNLGLQADCSRGHTHVAGCRINKGNDKCQHVQVLHMMMGLERIERMRMFAAELTATASPAPRAGRLAEGSGRAPPRRTGDAATVDPPAAQETGLQGRSRQSTRAGSVSSQVSRRFQPHVRPCTMATRDDLDRHPPRSGPALIGN